MGVITLGAAAFAMMFIEASSGSASSNHVSTVDGKIAADNGKHAPDTPTNSRGDGHGPKLVWLKIMAFADAGDVRQPERVVGDR